MMEKKISECSKMMLLISMMTVVASAQSSDEFMGMRACI
jgi:hypothetical protein